MKQITSLLAAVTLALPLAAQAQEDAAIKKNGCLKCHSVSADKDGPSFKKSAAKYKGQPDKLQAFLKAGKGHLAVKNDADLKSIVAYILSR